MSTKYKPAPQLMAVPEADRIRWAEALESGKYKQGRGSLFDNGCYCCLGVLQEINGLPVYSQFSEDYETDIPAEWPADTGHISLPSLNEVDYLLALDEDGESYGADKLNDDAGLSFKQIAQLIRGNEVAA